MLIEEKEYKKIKDTIEFEENLKNNIKIDNVIVNLKFYSQSINDNKKFVTVDNWQENMSYMKYIDKIKSLNYESVNSDYYISDTCVGKAILFVMSLSPNGENRLIWMFEFSEI